MSSQDKHYQSALEAWRAGKETRAIVTPFAFNVDESLLGTRLARPWQRLLAIGIDGVLVALLSYVTEALVLLVAALIVWRLTRNHQIVLSAWARRWLRFISGMVIVAVLLSLLSGLSDSLEEGSELSQTSAQVSQVFSGTTALFSVSRTLQQCTDKACIERQLPELNRTLDKLFAGQTKARHQAAKELLDELKLLSDADKQRYLAQLAATDSGANSVTDSVKNAAAKATEHADEAADANADASANAEQALRSVAAKNTNEPADDSDNKHSLLAWFQGVMQDFGLGLSWAALYFTLFTALWQGQTPAKKLLRIKVVRLNGEPLSLWNAFSRYGGYAAGVTTGLIGFLQVYWDSNRQCIQDKIGETVVIQQ